MSFVKDRRLDAKQGTNIAPKTYTPDQAETSVLAGQINAVFVGCVGWAKSPQEGQHVELRGLLQAVHGRLPVQPSLSVQSLSALKGKKVASLGPVSGDESLARIDVAVFPGGLPAAPANTVAGLVAG